MRSYGPPSVLGVEAVALPALAPGEVLVRGLASAINHSDLEIRAGNWPIRRADPFPYVPGLEVVGDIEAIGGAVTGFRPGDRVITMMQGLGGVRSERPGGYAQYVVVAAEAAALVPRDIDPLDLSALGLAAVTAHEGLRKIGPLAGRRIVVTGAGGGVGSAAVGIARAAGAEVVGIVPRDEQRPYVRGLGAAEALTIEEVARGALGEETVDGLLDNVAGPCFAAFVAALRPGGTLSVVGAVGGHEVRLDAYGLMEVTLTGYSSETLDGGSLRRAITAITGWLREGRLAVPARTLFPLAEAAAAHERLERRGVRGRLILVPDGAHATA
jgi:NADPH2:quinone reductase